jgi:hypothetical protein
MVSDPRASSRIGEDVVGTANIRVCCYRRLDCSRVNRGVGVRTVRGIADLWKFTVGIAPINV